MMGTRSSSLSTSFVIKSDNELQWTNYLILSLLSTAKKGWAGSFSVILNFDEKV